MGHYSLDIQYPGEGECLPERLNYVNSADILDFKIYVTAWLQNWVKKMNYRSLSFSPKFSNVYIDIIN